MRWMKALLSAALMGTIGYRAAAQVIPVGNASFESPSQGACGFNLDAATWTESGGGGV